VRQLSTSSTYNFSKVLPKVSPKVVCVDRSGYQSVGNFDTFDTILEVSTDEIDKTFIEKEEKYGSSPYFDKLRESLWNYENGLYYVSRIRGNLDHLGETIYIKEQKVPGSERPYDLFPHLEPLCITSSWNEGNMEIFRRVWTSVLENDAFDNPKFVNDMETIGQTKDHWAYDFLNPTPFPFLNEHVMDWSLHTGHSFGPVLGLLYTMYGWNICDGSVANKTLIDENNFMIKFLRGNKEAIRLDYHYLNNEIGIREEIDRIGLDEFIRNIQPYVFSKVVPDHRAWWLQTMYDALGDSNVTHNGELDRIRDDPLVKQCDHSEWSLKWTFDNLKHIEEHGWTDWCKYFLKN
jgi:hypothetical protein